MTKVITCGLKPGYDFGSPSLLHGIYELLVLIYGNQFEMLNIQMGALNGTGLSDMPFETVAIDSFRTRELIYYYYFQKKSDRIKKIIELLDGADYVIDLYGICFCDTLDKIDHPKLVAPLYVMSEFPVATIAHKLGIKTIKNTASYGPVISDYSQSKAKFAAKHIFDQMIAREENSRREIRKVISNNNDYCIEVSPDTANLMRVTEDIRANHNTIGISVSHQMVRQLNDKHKYISCLTDLCEHIIKEYSLDVLLIPNECDPLMDYNDVHCAQEVYESLNKRSIDCAILDVLHKSSEEIKNNIAGCKLIVASRYHSCVAALSSGIPVLVMGWHYKYEELLKLYGQDRWILPLETINSDALKNIFDDFYLNAEDNKRIIISRKNGIIDTIVKSMNETIRI